MNLPNPSGDWTPNHGDFGWRARLDSETKDLVHKLVSEVDATTFLSFLSKLEWKVQGNCSVAYVELTFLFCHRGFSFEATPQPTATFLSVLKVVKRLCSRIFQLECQTALPGVHQSTLIHKCDKAIPKGAIYGARPYIAGSELAIFAGILLEGCGQSLQTWKFDVGCCGS